MRNFKRFLASSLVLIASVMSLPAMATEPYVNVTSCQVSQGNQTCDVQLNWYGPSSESEPPNGPSNEPDRVIRTPPCLYKGMTKIQCTEFGSKTYSLSAGEHTFRLMTAGANTSMLLADATVNISYGAYTKPFNWSASTHNEIVGDFNDDGVNDIIVQPLTKGDNTGLFPQELNAYFDSSIHKNWTGSHPQIASIDDWSAENYAGFSGNFNSNPGDELLLLGQRNIILLHGDIITPITIFPTVNNAIVSWAANGTATHTAFSFDANPEDYVVLTGDLSGDGYDEIFLQAKSKGSTSYILSNSGALVQTINNGFLNMEWSAASYTASISGGKINFTAKSSADDNNVANTNSSGAVSSLMTAITKPTISGSNKKYAFEGLAYSFAPSVTTSASSITFSATGMPSWMSVNSSTGVLSGTPTASDTNMSHTITLTVVENKSHTVKASMSVKIEVVETFQIAQTDYRVYKATDGTLYLVSNNGTDVYKIVDDNGEMVVLKSSTSELNASGAVFADDYRAKITDQNGDGNFDLVLIPIEMGSSNGIYINNIDSNDRFVLVGSFVDTAPEAHVEELPAQDIESDGVGSITGDFRVNEGGQATYTVPIMTPKGSGGVSPSVSLSYNSGAGKGNLGMGWSLNASSVITRCRRTAEQDGIGNDNDVSLSYDDVFCLDGQRLVLINNYDYGKNGAEYRTAIDSQTRVISYGTRGNGPAYFEVWRKDGSKTTYGTSNNSGAVLRANDNGTVLDTVVSWFQSQAIDSSLDGNAINYQYSTSPESNGEIYLDKITYSPEVEITFGHGDMEAPIGSTSGGSISGYSLGGKSTLSKRLDFITVKDSGNVLRKYTLNYQRDYAQQQRVASISEESNGVSLPDTVFSWDDSSPNYASSTSRKLPYGRAHFAGKPAEINGDGKTDYYFIRYDVGYRNYYFNFYLSDGEKFSSMSCGIEISKIIATESARNNWYVLDYNVDGKSDIIFYDGTWKVLLMNSDGNCFDGSPIDTGIVQPYVSEGRGSLFSDFNGDGLVDMLYSSSLETNIRFRERTSSGEQPYKFSDTVKQVTYSYTSITNIDSSYPVMIYPSSSCSYQDSYNNCSYNSASDFNSDGKADMVAFVIYHPIGGNGYEIEYKQVAFTSDGKGHFEEYGVLELNESSALLATSLMTLDLNSDGLGDFLYRQSSDGRWYYKLNTGKGLLPAVLITQIEDGGSYDHDGGTDHDNQNGVEGKNITPIDWNMDGFIDLVYVHNGKLQVVTWQPDSQSYNNSITTSIEPINKKSAIYPVDFNGDGSTDLLDTYLKHEDDKSRYQVHIQNMSAYSSNKISKIDNGLGNITNIKYGASNLTTDLYVKGTGGAELIYGNGSPVFDANSPMTLVKEARSTAPDFDNSTRQAVVTYQYGEAKMQAGGRGSLGFKWIESTDVQSGIKTKTTYRQDYPYIGMSEQTQQKLDDNLLSLSTNTYLNKQYHDNKVLFPYLSRSVEETWSLNSPAIKLKKVITQFGEMVNGVSTDDYDSYGNPLKILSSTYEGSEWFAQLIGSKQVVNQYDNNIDSSKWHLGRLKNSTVTHTAQNSLATERNSSFEYDPITGLLSKEIIEANGEADKKLTTVYKHDDFGNITQKSVCSIEVTDCGVTTSQDTTNAQYINRIVYSEYDTDGRYVEKTKNVYEQVTSQVISRNSYGQPTSVRGLDDVITDTVYTTFGGKYFSRNSTGKWSKVTKALCDGSINCPIGSVVRVKTQINGQGYSYTFIDALGNKLKQSSRNFANNGFDSVDYYFDAQGRNYIVSEPYADSGADVGEYFTTTLFDDIGRVTRIINPDSTFSTIIYQGLTSTLTNELEQTRITVKNQIGQTVSVTDNMSNVLSYKYDSTGNLTELSLNGVLQSIMVYDNLGRKISMKDWDKGGQNDVEWTYKYNALGELVSQTDAKLQLTENYRDALGRNINTKLYDASNTLVESTQWVYNNNIGLGGSTGQLTSESFLVSSNSSSYSKSYFYDDLGRGIKVLTEIDDDTYFQETTFDEYGRVFQSFDASGDQKGLRYLYNDVGYLYKTREAFGAQHGRLFKEIKEIDARGNISRTKSGNGLITIKTYTAARGFLDIITTGKDDSSGMVQHLAHHFNSIGNLEHKENILSGVVEDYRYDPLNRLDAIDRNGGEGFENEADYDSWGNISWKRGIGNYTYNTKETSCTLTAGRHALTNAGGSTYCYDQNGNQINGGGRSVNYSTFDKATQIVKGNHTTQFDYNVNHNRFKRTDIENGETTTTLYLGNVEIIKSNTETEIRRNLGNTIVSQINGASNSRYIFTDQIGSTDVVTNSVGSELQRFVFDAWGKKTTGEVISPLGNAFTLRGFTGHESVEEADIIHMNGRIYDPTLGRFLQSDPFIQSPKNSQSLNRYSYVLNNPLTLTDPSGYFSLKRWQNRNSGHLRTIAAIYIATVTGGQGATWGSAVVGGATAGTITTGTMKGAVIGAFSAGLFNKIGAQNWSRPRAAFAHGIVAGTANVLSGGKFGHGFASAWFGKMVSEHIMDLGTHIYTKTAIASIIGGTVSELTGGKFANGALTGAMQFAFNESSVWEGEVDDMIYESMGSVSGLSLTVSLDHKAVEFSLSGIDNVTIDAVSTDGEVISIDVGKGVSVNSKGEVTVSASGKIYNVVNINVSQSTSGTSKAALTLGEIDSKSGTGVSLRVVEVEVNIISVGRNIVRAGRKIMNTTETEFRSGGKLRGGVDLTLKQRICAMGVPLVCG
jgi:RHS repeat-associated protein